ncbi:hypothetical protein M569_13769, partial [Genlisea aurea]
KGPMEKQKSFKGPMEKQKSFKGPMEKQKSFRIVMERQNSFGASADRRKSKDSPGKRGDSPLHLAARAGNLGKAREIIQKIGSSENAVKELMSKQNHEGETPLYVAADNGHISVVAEFLKHSDAETCAIPANNGFDPFHVAAKQGHIEVVKQMLQSFPTLVMTTDATNSTVLHTAAALGHKHIVDLLLDADSNLAKIARNNGKTVLHTVARMGNLEVMKSLLSSDPGSVFRTDRKGQTPLHMAVKGQNVDVVQELVKHDPSVLSPEDNKGNTALHTAIIKGRSKIVLFLLSVEGIDVNAVNGSGETPLDIADKFGSTEMTTMLQRAGAAHSEAKKPQSAAKQLKQTVSDIKHDVKSQLQQARQTGFRVKRIANKVKKLHTEGLNNAITSATVVAVLIATVAFAAIFIVPGQYVGSPQDGFSLGEANVANDPAFLLFFLFDSVALFISLAVVLVQTSVVVIEHRAKKQLMFVINKFMWMACLFISAAFVSLTYIVVGPQQRGLAIYATILGSTVMLTTIGSMCYCIVRHRMEDSRMRSLRRNSTHSRSMSMSVASDTELYSERYNRMYAL